MLIHLTAMNGEARPIAIGVGYIILIERHEPVSEGINAMITVPNRVIYVAETYEQIIDQIKSVLH